jgi:ATP-dependent DNA ligase
MNLVVRPPLEPMLAKLERALPSGDFVYEPKWDGFRALVFRNGDDVDIRSRHDKKLARYFPEIVEAIRTLGEPKLVLDGELVIPSGENLDFAALMARLHPAASRVEQLRMRTPAVFVAFDVLALGERDLRSAAFAQRREALLELFEGAPRGRVVLTPATSDPNIARTWLTDFSSRGIDGVVAKAPSLPYSPGKRAMIKVKHERTADVVVAGMRLLGTPGDRATYHVGSLLLGVYDAHARLVHVGVVSQLPKARRFELFAELAPLATDLEGHPWQAGFGLERSPLGRLAGSAGRWAPDMTPDWLPLAPVRVCEVSYTTIDEHRFRYPARFVRWRPDRDPRSCGFEQLEPSADAHPNRRGDVSALLAESVPP